MAANKKGLGKGLGALFDGVTNAYEKESEQVFEIDINDISPKGNQPRKAFDEEALLELANSIKENGVLQPIILQKKGSRNYVIVAGERRWRASRLAGLKTIPAIVRELADEEALRHALIENIQREDLNPIEEARAYKDLMDNFKLTQEELSKTIGKSRSAVANILRLNKLCEEVQNLLITGELSEGHGRALLPLDSREKQIEVAQIVMERGYNVRQTEEYVRFITMDRSASTRKRSYSAEDEQYLLSIKKVEDQISKSIGAKVKLKDKAGKGKIEIPYKNLDELDRLIAVLTD